MSSSTNYQAVLAPQMPQVGGVPWGLEAPHEFGITPEQHIRLTGGQDEVWCDHLDSLRCMPVLQDSRARPAWPSKFLFPEPHCLHQPTKSKRAPIKKWGVDVQTHHKSSFGVDTSLPMTA